ncbi:MAG: hypothetical protein PF569_02040 [Candidatus Woesearchaeota archaeon]|nr:hypothetical protein [Candidatus Woesearchaeota archaeon]
MKIDKVEVLHVKLPFKHKFKHSSQSRGETENIIIKLYFENEEGIGECLPREYVTGENPQTVIETLERKIIPYFKEIEFNSFEDILITIDGFLPNINKNELSAFSAYEQALLNLSAKIYNKDIEDILNFYKIKFKKKDCIEYSAVFGIDSKLKIIIKSLLVKLLGFKHLKVKISKNNIKNLFLIRKILKNIDLRVDANESFSIDDIVETIEILNQNKIKLFEQPFKVEDGNIRQMYNYCFTNKIKIILDESLCTFDDTKKLIGQKEGDIAMIRISKNGGICNSLKIYEFCRKNYIPVILGCLVGETVLTRYNLLLGQYLETIENEGDYDSILFEKPIFINPKFNKKGKFKNLPIYLNFKDTLNSSYKEFVITRKLY